MEKFCEYCCEFGGVGKEYVVDVFLYEFFDDSVLYCGDG